MAYSTGNPPHLRGDQPVAGPRSWVYRSTHLNTVVGTSDFINNGLDIGMAIADTLEVISSAVLFEVSYHVVTKIGSTYVTLSSGLIISSAS